MADRQNALTPRPGCDKRGHLSVFHLKAVAAGAALVLVVTVGVRAQAGGAGTAPTQLAWTYTAAVATANITALPPVMLAGLGTPTPYAVYENTRVPAAGKGWIGYSSAPPATLNIDGHNYAQGGQFTWHCYNNYSAAGYVWNISRWVSTWSWGEFTAVVGEDLGHPRALVRLSFLGNGKPLPFLANGKTVASLLVPSPASKPVPVTVPLSGSITKLTGTIAKLTVVLTQVNMENTAVENYTVDFGNARLSDNWERKA